MDDEAIDRFLAEIDKYPQMWDSLEARGVFAEKLGVQYLLGLYCTFSFGLLPQKDVLFESPGLAIVKEIYPFSQLRGLLKGLQSGEVPLAGRAVKVDGFSQFGVNSWAGGGQGWIDTSYPYVLLHSTGKSVREVVSEDDITKQLLAYGYRDIYNLAQEKVGFQVGGSYPIQIRVIAPVFLEASAAFVGDNLRLALRCWPSIEVADLTASYEVVVNLFGKRETRRDQVDLSDSARIEEAVGYSLVKELDLLPEAESAMVWVFHATRSEPMYALRATKAATLRSNLVWGATSLILTRQSGGQVQDAPKILRDSLGLDNQVKDAGRLEVAVHALLGCAGFVCIFSGREWGIQGIDTLAFPPGMKKVFAISITSTNNIGEKIRTMLPPISKLKKELSDLPISPAIVAPIEPGDVVNSDQEDANTHGVQLILRPQLAELLDAVMNVPQDHLADRVRSLFRETDNPLIPSV